MAVTPDAVVKESLTTPPAKPAAAPCPACGGRLRGSRLLHDGDGAEVYRVRRCAGCSRVWWDRFALRPLGLVEAPRP